MKSRAACPDLNVTTTLKRLVSTVMNGVPISLFEEATERTSSKDGEDGWMICSECAELEEEPLLANTTLIWQTRILSGSTRWESCD